MHLPIPARRLGLSAILAALVATGCSPSKTDTSLPSASPNAPFELRLLVVDDPAMAEAIGRLRAEWKARSGASFSVVEMPLDELLSSATLPAATDAVIYPSRQLGLLIERGLIAPLPPAFAGSKQLDWPDVFELLQTVEATWGGAAYAVPFGSPVLTCYCRADLLQQHHKRPPRTWSEYHALAEFFSRRENLGDAAPPADAPWFGAVEPLATSWGGGVLLARAASYAKHRDHFSTLFKIETMEPLIGGAAFVRALEEMAADARLGPPNQLELDPEGARREFFAGHAALAITWPAHAGRPADDSGARIPPVAFGELPGSAKVYNFVGKAWENRESDESQRVPLLSLAGRLGSVTRATKHADEAFQLLSWLCGLEWGPKVSSASPATTLYRRSQLRDALPWLDTGTDPTAARQYAESVRDALSRPAYLSAPRIPGQDRYIAALDRAVQQTLRDKRPAAESLAAAAAEWAKITAELGVESQRQAYRKSLALEP